MLEQRVPQRQQRVPLQHRSAREAESVLPEQPRLPTLGLDVRVRAEEGLVRACLVPANKKFRVGVSEEATHVGTSHGQARKRDREQHGCGGRQVAPLGRVVASPDGAMALRASEEGAREDEGARGLAGRPLDQTAGGGHVLVEAVQVVPLAMLHAGQRLGVLGHGHFRAVEHRRLVHVVPRVQMLRGARVVVQREAVGPPLTHTPIREVEVRRGAGPAPAVEIRPVLGLDVVAEALRLGMHRIARVALDVRVHNGHHLAPAGGEAALHVLGGRERVLVPREVTLAVRVLNVQPQHIVWEVVLLKLGIHCRYIRLVLVVPAALVVGQREAGRQESGPGERGVLAHHVQRRRASEQEQVHDARLGDPMGRSVLAVALDVHKRLRRVEPKHAHRAPRAVAKHEGDGAVQSHGLVQLVLKHIQIVQPVGLRVAAG
mmetsp:Transcript_8836/g.27859  ORF Transcript_8836/g.27859 Transcript_8836/m.27859 type:complete len:431 (-) Transcript_8836:843-2135(-)